MKPLLTLNRSYVFSSFFSVEFQALNAGWATLRIISLAFILRHRVIISIENFLRTGLTLFYTCKKKLTYNNNEAEIGKKNKSKLRTS